MKSKITLPLFCFVGFSLSLLGFGFTSGMALIGGKPYIPPLLLCAVALAVSSCAVALAGRRNLHQG